MICPLCHDISSLPFACVDAREYFRCRCCQLTFLDPAQLPDADTEHRHYQLHENDPADSRYRAWLERLAGPLGERLANASEGLDFGCGPGPALALMLSERGHRMSVYDPLFAPDSSVLERQYDFVTCTEVVEHFHQPAKEFALFTSLLRPRGLLAIMTSLLHDGIDFEKWHYRRDPTHVCFYREQTLAWFALHNGLTLVYASGPALIMQRLH